MEKPHQKTDHRSSFELLYYELERIELNKLNFKKLYYIDEETGETIPVAEQLSRDVNEALYKLQRKFQRRDMFAIVNQKEMDNLINKVSMSSLKVIMFLLSKMNFSNIVEHVGYKDICNGTGCAQTTVVRAIKELAENEVVMIREVKGKYTYMINPLYFRKGPFYQIKMKMKPFCND